MKSASRETEFYMLGRRLYFDWRICELTTYEKIGELSNKNNLKDLKRGFIDARMESHTPIPDEEGDTNDECFRSAMDEVGLNIGCEMSEKLKPCPFCGGDVSIGISDDEGNPRDEEYEVNPWSGLSYTLIHENYQNEECPIATHSEEILGSLLYESRQEAIDMWNGRQCC